MKPKPSLAPAGRILKPVKTAGIHSLKDYYVAIGVALIVMVGIFAGLVPTVGDIFAIRQEIGQLEAKLDVLDAKFDTLSQYTDAELTRMVESVEGALPSDKPIFQAVSMMQNLAIENGLVVDKFDFSPGSVATESAQTASKSEGSSLTLTANLSGSFENLLSFVQAVETAGPLTGVEGFSVSSAASFENNIRTTMTLKIYHMPSPEAIGKVDAPIKSLSNDQLAAIEQMADLRVVANSALLAPTGLGERANPFEF